MSTSAALIGTALLAVVLWASTSGDAGGALAFLTSHPWSIATTADLYAGFACFGLVLFRLEGTLPRTLAWLLPTLVLGNLVPALYLALHLRRIRRREALDHAGVQPG